MAHIFKLRSLEQRSSSAVARVNEPDLVMGGEQVDAYHLQSSWGGDMDPMHLFHLAHLVSILKDGFEVLDLACGTGNLLLKTAQIFPNVRFVGADLSESMLASAEKTRQQLNIQNVRFVRQDISRLEVFRDNSFDAVTSTMALHHLPDVETLLATARAINRVLKKNGAIYLSDFIRMRSDESIHYLVSDLQDQKDEIFKLDFLNSLKAAFSRNDFEKFVGCLEKSRASLKASRIVEFIFVIGTMGSFNPFRHLQIFLKVPLRRISLKSWWQFLQLKALL